MNHNPYSRRRFVRHGLTLAGAGFLSGAVGPSSAAIKNTDVSPVTPDQAFDELMAGNQRYVTGKNTHHDFGPERAALAQSQHPFAIVLGCADSRVSPELCFDQSRGRLFVVRLAGNFMDDNGLASMEFGASVLESSLILVLGHTECGAVKAAVDVVTKGATLPGHLPKLVSYLTGPVEKVRSEGGNIVDRAIRENVVWNVANLRRAEPILAGLVKEGRLRVAGGIYDLATGKVDIVA
jgi:carbonic anhydrase